MAVNASLIIVLAQFSNLELILMAYICDEADWIAEKHK